MLFMKYVVHGQMAANKEHANRGNPIVHKNMTVYLHKYKQLCVCVYLCVHIKFWILKL